MRGRLLDSGHTGSVKAGIWAAVFDGSTYSHTWPVVAVDLTISNHGIQSSGPLRMVLAVVTAVEDMLEVVRLWWSLFEFRSGLLTV